MTERPPQKRLKQCSIFQAFKKQKMMPISSQSQETSPSHSEENAATPSTSADAQPHASPVDGETAATSNASCTRSKADHDEKPAAVERRSKEGSTKDAQFIGTAPSELRSSQTCSAALPPLTTSHGHTVLVKTPYQAGQVPLPSFPEMRDKWDQDHVKMPYSLKNLYPFEKKDGSKELRKRWEMIETALLDDISSSVDLEEAILSYNSRYSQKWDFRGLHAFFTQVLGGRATREFFTQTMPKLVQLALQLPNICTQAIPMLKQHKAHSLTLSQKQIGSLLANAFFSTFPRRNKKQTFSKNSEYSNYPEINFIHLFQGSKQGLCQRKAEKLKCILNYFKRIITDMPKGTVTYRRQVLRKFPDWGSSESPLTRLSVSAGGTIEDDGCGMLQVDFANKFIGGGVLGYGCVQEEIRFLVCPEMIVSRLFTEVLDNNECLIMTGCERFSSYKGYADTFEWAGDYNDCTSRDSWGRKQVEVVAIDAMVFRKYKEQFNISAVRRELNKAYCGFAKEELALENVCAVATGNWGCGAFGGDTRLKALIQIMAAAEARRDLCYFTFGDCDLRDHLAMIHKFITEKKLSVSDLWSMIRQYHDNVGISQPGSAMDLFEYICSVYEDHGTDTDTTDNGSIHEADAAQLSQEVAAERPRKASPDYDAETP